LLYKVHEDCTVLWPDGSVRAVAGDVFDGCDTDGTKRSIDFASAMLASHRNHIAPSTDAVTATDMPASVASAFADLADTVEVDKPIAAVKPKRKAAKKVVSPEPIADPGEE
tara:strand:- start:668 stop:1000 length:333 start_codon:yes stop_codon:yes gene_type:complete